MTYQDTVEPRSTRTARRTSRRRLTPPSQLDPRALRPLVGELEVGRFGRMSVRVPLQRFELTPDMTAGAIAATLMIDTAFVLRDVELPIGRLEDLPNSIFRFPMAGEPDDERAIDGSLYLACAHHPYDVEEISFGSQRGDLIETTIRGFIDWSYQGIMTWERQPAMLRTALRVVKVSEPSPSPIVLEELLV